MNARYGLLALGVMAISACGSQPGDQAASDADGRGEKIACAVGGAADFSNDCGVERTNTDGKLFLTVHHPDGAFRRFEVMKDGSGVATADGADQAVSKLSGETLEVAIGADRYRFPAKAGPSAKQGDVAKP